MEQTDPRHLLISIVRILEKLDIPYFITGGMAVLAWGRLRFTADVDILVELKPKDIGALESALRSLGGYGYIDKDAIQEALSLQGEFNFIDGNTGVKVDFWILKRDSFDLLKLKRKVVKEVLGQRVYFISPEDLVLNKLVWYRDSGSSRHLEDAESVIKISGSGLDYKYLKNWAKKLQVLDILEGLGSF